jgi:hypothetical protein
MTQLELLRWQTDNAYSWTNTLLNSIPFEKWDLVPDIVESSISWQAGHLIMSFYFHSIMVVVGHQKDVLQKIPLREYDGLFTVAAPRDAVGKVNPQELFDHLKLMQQKSLEVISGLSADDLEKDLMPSPTPHPIAKNKLEAIDWNIKHTMWHCGQIGLIKRVVDERFNFGLKRS